MKQHLSDYVNPCIGTISHMLTSTKPEVLYPYGMARSAPVVDDCGDYYCNDRIRGFALGDAYIMPACAGRSEIRGFPVKNACNFRGDVLNYLSI